MVFEQELTPAPNFLKINCDGAFRENTCSGGWGFVIRNDEGEALAAGAGHLQCLSDAFHERSNMHQSWAPHHSGDRCTCNNVAHHLAARGANCKFWNWQP
ncbi:hypothetical protein BRADI_4g13209v3 [Brachypodium distachyon]|uniref:Uncharacterized protein n=1 Tax=Brachypodium distachyon TaxID=15368 RepID=A0A0Q3EJ04_BRADI|nr:hypothetical protein BRADI_4g13209v3 [Brachypodium distachyon]